MADNPHPPSTGGPYPSSAPVPVTAPSGPGGPYPAPPPVPNRPVPPPPREAWRRPRRVDAVPGTPFAVVQLDVPPVVSGPAVGALAAGIGSILLALAVGCFGVSGAGGGWGGWVAGAFAVPGVLFGVAAMVLGLLSRRQIRAGVAPSAVRFTGRGLAVAGISCGAVGLGLTLAALAVALLLQV